MFAEKLAEIALEKEFSQEEGMRLAQALGTVVLALRLCEFEPVPLDDPAEQHGN